ncbi:family 16 glycosylhydrolase [Novosphingobium tardum]|uniref:Family 16 glycosylhydrolase n=1 Tax=Novosphingobium tardum TaxID=1538021 RepID=A0ABV8RT50_9SPHN
MIIPPSPRQQTQERKLRYPGSLMLLAMVGCNAASVSAEPGPVTVPPGYELVWSDEFDRDGALDPAKWTFEQGYVRNGEMQWYQSENAQVSGGRLIIEGRREHKPNPLFGSPALKPQFRARRTINFTSASVSTKGRQSWTYGHFEIRAKIRAEQGLWPALWFVGTEGRWPAGGEIDLMEYYQGRILANFGWASKVPGKPTWNSVKVPVSELGDNPGWDESFHVWTMDWDAKQISLHVDGRLINQLDLSKVDSANPTGIANPFRRPQYLIMNLALGGENGGPLQDTRLPTRFEIDYVRVYQRTGGLR